MMHKCNEQDTECCVVQFESTFSNIYVLDIYRATTGESELFLNKLENTINYLHKPNHNLSFVVTLILSCWNLPLCLNSLPTFFNLMSMVNFPQEFKITAVLPLIVFLYMVPGKIIFVLNQWLMGYLITMLKYRINFHLP